MSDLHDYRQRRQQIRKLWRRHNESQTTLAVVMTGIAALFIAGIAAAFIYASDTSPTQTAAYQPAPAETTSAPSPAASTPAAPATRALPETTGSGGNGPGIRPKHDPREDEQMERPR